MHQREEGFTWFSGDGTRASRIDYILTRDCPPTDATLTPLFFSDHIMLSCTLSLPTGVTVGGGLWKLNCSLLEDEDVVREYREQFSQWQTLQDFYDSRAQWWEMVKERTRQYFRKIPSQHVEGGTANIGHQGTFCFLFLNTITVVSHDELTRAVFYFLWGSKWERLKRDVIKKKAENGGKGLPDPHLFLGSRFTALHIQYAVTPSGENKTAAMTRFWTGPVPGLTLSEAKQVWRNAAHPTLQNRHKDLSWMVAHEILPVREVMHPRGMDINPTCPRSGCNFPETVRHLLWECGAARDLWAKTAPLYFPCLPAGGAQIGYQLAILGVGQGLKDLTTQDFTSLWLTLNVIKDAIWATRNLLVGKRVTVPLHACELKVTSMLQGGGPGPHRKGPGRHRCWPPVDAPSPLWLREQRASGPEERGSPLSPGNNISLACSGEKITDSLVLIRDAICYARDRNIRLVVLNLDFEKAFDRVSHQYLFQVLQKMGFPERFIAWVGLLYKGLVSKILVNGHLSKAVNIYSGVRQGCPLSPLLYVACIEPLAQILRRDKWIKGLDVPGTGGLTATCVLYMDDVTLLATDVLSVRRAMDLTDWYGRASGAKLNRSKSEAQLFGPWDRNWTDFPPRTFLAKLDRAVFYFLWGSNHQEKTRKRWKRPPRPPPVFRQPLHRPARWIRHDPIQRKQDSCNDMFLDGVLLKNIKDFTRGLENPDREPVSPIPGLTLCEAKQVWKNASHPALQNRHKDLLWMVAHEILPVRAVMHSRGMAKNLICPRSECNSPETVRHLLWECSAARDLWAKTAPLYFPCLPAGGAQIGYQLAILGVGRGLKDLTAQDFTSLWLTLNVIKDAIWATRNLLVGKCVTVPLHACELKVTSMLQGYRATIFGQGGRGRTERVPAATVAGRP
ncbi:hypothetical protein M9458_054528, partial [Cirrhinus mrigala]